MHKKIQYMSSKEETSSIDQKYRTIALPPGRMPVYENKNQFLIIIPKGRVMEGYYLLCSLDLRQTTFR